MSGTTRLVNFRSSRGSAWRAGVELDGHFVDVASLPSFADDENVTVDSLVRAGADATRRAIEAAREAASNGVGTLVAKQTVELGPPILCPSKILCVGFNYRAHADEFDVEMPEHPTLFAKFSNSLVGPYDAVRIPAVSKEIDYEGELAVVIGETCKDVRPEDALSVVAGYSVINDVTARDLQFRTSQFTSGKALDTFAPMGPGLVTADDVPDPSSLQIATYLNGEQVQDGNTGLMMFGVADLVARVSELMTLYPGDVIATGTPAGVGYKRTPPVFLKPGDIVEVDVERVGRISNTFTDKDTRKEQHDD